MQAFKSILDDRQAKRTPLVKSGFCRQYGGMEYA